MNNLWALITNNGMHSDIEVIVSLIFSIICTYLAMVVYPHSQKDYEYEVYLDSIKDYKNGNTNPNQKEKMETKYKVLNKDLTSPYQNFKFELGKEFICTDFDLSNYISCSKGFYATGLDGLPYAYGINKSIFECEVSGKSVIFNQFKQRHEKMTITKKLSTNEVQNLLKTEKTAQEVGYNIELALFPVNPLKLKSTELTQKEIDLLKKWASVWASVRDSVRDSVWASVGASVWVSVRALVRDSVWDSVWDSVGDSVWASVRDSVWDSVGDSVGASVWAYISSIFTNIKEWKHIDHKIGVNPFQSCIDLWNSGFVPSFDGTIWRLHTGEDARIVYEWNPKNKLKMVRMT